MSDDIVDRLNITADMIGLGDKIRYGSDSAIMREAADEIEKLRAELDAIKSPPDYGTQKIMNEQIHNAGLIAQKDRENERIRAENEKLRAELVEAQRFASEMDKNAFAKAETCTMLMKDNEKLRAALRPIAWDFVSTESYSSETKMSLSLTVAELRAAKAALGESDE